MNADERIAYINYRLAKHLEAISDKYEVVGVFLQGSQNYGLDIYEDDYKSDVDTKAIVLPSFEDVVYNRPPVSTTIVLDNNEHVDVKDVRVMFDNFKKQNTNFIEILFTPYRILNGKYYTLVQPIFDNAERIAHLDYNKALSCIAGMSEQKFVALKHPYPTIVDKIKKFGYDPKQLHHIFRLNDFIKKYINGIPYAECLIPDDKDYLIEIKKGEDPSHSPEQSDWAEISANFTNADTYAIANHAKDPNRKVDTGAIELLDKVKYELLKEHFKEELLWGNKENVKN